MSDEPVFTVKEWLQRIDSKQDHLEAKIDRLAEGVDKKADASVVADLIGRITIIETQGAARTSIVDRQEGRIEELSKAISGKANASELTDLRRTGFVVLGSAAVAILAWALTVLSGVHFGAG